MNGRIPFIFPCIAILIFLFTNGASAQMVTGDLAVIKAGYQRSVYEYDLELSEPLEYNGVAVMGEYNLNLGMLHLGFGVEWSRLVNKDDRDTVYQFITPSASLKLVVPGGFYIGAGAAGKHLLDQNIPGGDDFDRKWDLWVHGIAGYYLSLTETAYLDLEGRFGWNITKNQFSDNIDVLTHYDITLYAGIGFRTRSIN